MNFSKLVKLARSDSSILVIARLLAMGSILLLVRIGGEEPTGIFALISSSTGILAFLLAIGIPTNYTFFVGVENWPHSTITAAAILFAIFFGFIGVIIWLTLCPIVRTGLFHDSISILSLRLAAACIPLAIIQTHSLGLLQAFNCLRLYAICNFVALAVPAFFSVIFYLAMGHPEAIVYGYIAGLTTSGMTCIICVAQEVKLLNFHVSFGQIRRLVYYGLTGYLGGLASLANYRLDRLLIGVFVGTSAAGAYSIISRIAELGRIVPIALQTSFAPKAANMTDIDAWNRSKKLIRHMSVFTFVVMVLLVPLGAMAISILGIESASWQDQLLLCVGIFFVAISAPTMGYFIAAGRPSRNTLAAVAGLIATLVLAPILIPKYETTGACVASCMAYIVFGMLLLALFSRGPVRHACTSQQSSATQ